MQNDKWVRVRVGRESDVPMVCLLIARRGHHAILHYNLCKLHNILQLLGLLKRLLRLY